MEAATTKRRDIEGDDKFVLSLSHNSRFFAWFSASLSAKKQSDPICHIPLIFQYISARCLDRGNASSRSERLE